MVVEIDSKLYAVSLTTERWQLLVKMAEGLSDDGRLKVHPLDSSFQFNGLPVLRA